MWTAVLYGIIRSSIIFIARYTEGKYIFGETPEEILTIVFTHLLFLSSKILNF